MDPFIIIPSLAILIGFWVVSYRRGFAAGIAKRLQDPEIQRRLEHTHVESFEAGYQQCAADLNQREDPRLVR